MATIDPNKPTQGTEATTGVTTAPATGTTAAVPVANSTAAYNSARVDAINQMYDAQKNQQQQQLQATYDQQMSAAQAAADQIPQQYQERSNDLAVQYERNRRNLNQQAAGNGINTGAGSQQALALQSMYQRDYGGIQQQQANAQAEAQRSMADLTTQYQASVASALAQNDYQRAAALIDEYNNAQERDLKSAQVLAEFGDFSGYAALYGQEQADNMAAIWKYQNPDLAWNVGKITGEEYYKATGAYPRGYTPPSTASTAVRGYGNTVNWMYPESWGTYDPQASYKLADMANGPVYY